MKRLPATIILLLLFGLAMIPAVFAQSLPAPMAYPSSGMFLNTPAESGQKLLIAGNSLARDHRPVFDLGRIPAAPDFVARNSRIQSISMMAGENAHAAKDSASKLRRSAMLLGVLAIAYLATRKRREPLLQSDVSELRDFAKKRLAHREAHA